MRYEKTRIKQSVMCEERGLKRSMTTRSDLRTNGTARYNKKKECFTKGKERRREQGGVSNQKGSG